MRSRLTVRAVQFTKVITHRGQSQRLGKLVVMLYESSE